MRYAFAEEHADKWPVTALCRVLELSESGYYRYLKRKGKPNRDDLLSGEIQKIADYFKNQFIHSFIPYHTLI